MKYLVPTLTLLTGLAISCVTAWYSIQGLVLIFAGGMIGFALLEFAKIILTIVLHKHWDDGLGLVKNGLVASIIILMILTSMGVFGYLSKQSSAQSEGVSVNTSKVIFLEDTISRSKVKIDNNIRQIDIYNQSMAKLITDDITKASRERKRIQTEISSLASDNKALSAEVDKLSNELLPYKTEVNKHEVEIGPLLYITKLIYGDRYREYTDKTLSYLIILIVLVFDPLAIMLLITSQKSFIIVHNHKPITSPSHEDEILEDIIEPIVGDIVEVPVIDDVVEESQQNPMGRPSRVRVPKVKGAVPVVEAAPIKNAILGEV